MTSCVRATMVLLACVSLLPCPALASDEALCDWTVHYDEWVPSHANHEFEHNTVLGGANCLSACCQDPSCVGLQLESTLNGQCYKYDSKPKVTKAGLPLGDFLVTDGIAGGRVPAWSVFIKTPRATAVTDSDIVAREAALDRSLRGVYSSLNPSHAPLHESCDWEVHYDKWMPSFDHHQFGHEKLVGGTSCLNACCHDPFCTGLALESSLNSECHKYATLPSGLGETGQPLSVFLEAGAKPAWSVFVKKPRSLNSASKSGLHSSAAEREAALDKQLRQQTAAHAAVLTWNGDIHHASAADVMLGNNYDHSQHDHHHNKHPGNFFHHGKHHHKKAHHVDHHHHSWQEWLKMFSPHHTKHAFHHQPHETNSWHEWLNMFSPLHRRHHGAHGHVEGFEWSSHHHRHHEDASANLPRFAFVAFIGAVLLMFAWRRVQASTRKGGEFLLLRAGAADPECAGLMPKKQKETEMGLSK